MIVPVETMSDSRAIAQLSREWQPPYSASMMKLAAVVDYGYT